MKKGKNFCKHHLVETTNEIFKCTKCPFTTRDVKIMAYYASGAEAKKLMEKAKKGGIYTCQHCGKEFDKPGSLGAHVAMVHKGIDVTRFFKKKKPDKWVI